MNVLITGKHSYVGNHVGTYLSDASINVKYVSLRGKDWETFDFSQYDAIFHVAGIAHVPIKKTNESLYEDVNHQLTAQLAKKAKSEGIKHFIFMSSIMVYGAQPMIDDTSRPQPNNAYGVSKWDAEKALKKFESQSFKVSIIRAPMIYGANAEGNFIRLYKLGLKWPIWPYYDNKRSMLYIDNLSMFIKHVIESQASGVFHPQNSAPTDTLSLIKLIRKKHGKKTWVIKGFSPIIKGLKKVSQSVNKMFGDYLIVSQKDVLKTYYSLEKSIQVMETPDV